MTTTYQPLDAKTAIAIANGLQKLLSDLPAILKIDTLHVSKPVIAEIIDLVERRRLYFRVFHRIEIGELNETALYCFWILKLSPFYYDKPPVYSPREIHIKYGINVSVVLQLLISFIHRNHIPVPAKELIEKIAYAFRYRDLSKEALMALFEAVRAGTKWSAELTVNDLISEITTRDFSGEELTRLHKTINNRAEKPDKSIKEKTWAQPLLDEKTYNQSIVNKPTLF